MVKLRLAFGFVIMLLGIIIILRSILVIVERNVGLSALWQPLILGALMIAFGIHRWRHWRVKG